MCVRIRAPFCSCVFLVTLSGSLVDLLSSIVTRTKVLLNSVYDFTVITTILSCWIVNWLLRSILLHLLQRWLLLCLVFRVVKRTNSTLTDLATGFHFVEISAFFVANTRTN